MPPPEAHWLLLLLRVWRECSPASLAVFVVCYLALLALVVCGLKGWL